LAVAISPGKEKTSIVAEFLFHSTHLRGNNGIFMTCTLEQVLKFLDFGFQFFSVLFFPLSEGSLRDAVLIATLLK
jgi:hypothetical protein